MHQLLVRHFYAKRLMWTPVLIGTAFTLVAIPVWLGLYDVMGVTGFALASTLVMIGYSLGMLLAWGFDSGWAAVRRLAPAFLRSMLAALLAAGAGLLVTDLMLGDEISVGAALVVGLAAGAITLGVFILVSVGLRSPEMREVLRR
jgi:peptidoglycan biosynthesis protein MviN/MurJ (putative lipid II flippase)